MICSLCPRQCFAERDEATGSGFCGAGTLPRLARAALHFWEEPCISGARGSGAVFFSHCTLRCAFCQNMDISHEAFGKTITVRALADIFRRMTDEGAHNINLVTATHFAPAVLEALSLYRPPVPIVWDEQTGERFDKDRFRLDLGDIIPAYNLVLERLESI